MIAFSAFAVYEARHLVALSNDNLWWHLSSGQWSLQHHVIPRNGIFSQSASLPWIDSSWGFDLVLAAFFHVFGLRGLPVLFMCLQVILAVVLFILARGNRRLFWPAILLAVVAQLAISSHESGSSLCSMILLAVELALLKRAEYTGEGTTLLWLPLVFLAWANVDRQFFYGLLVLVLYFLANLSHWIAGRPKPSDLRIHPRIRLSTSGVTLGASLLATLVTPYGYRLDQLLWQTATSSASDIYFPGLHSMRFRQAQDYIVMLLAMAAFFALGRSRSRNIFDIAAMVVFTVISFRFQRDSWLIAIVSTGVLGNAAFWSDVDELPDNRRSWVTTKVLTASTLVLVLLIALFSFPNNSELTAKISQDFPVRASDYIRQHQLPQPLFNPYLWGGFLTWYLPEYPVVIDERADLYRDELNIPYFKLMAGELASDSHPGFAQAKTILLESDSPIAAVLATIPRFRAVYRDDQATVFVREF